MFISIQTLLFAVAFMNLYATYHTYQTFKDAKVRLDWTDGVIFGVGVFLSVLSAGTAILI